VADFQGSRKIGYLLFGGKRQLEAEAYEEGRMRTAQTEKALAEARLKQLERTSLEAQERAWQGYEQALADAGDENAPLIAIMSRAGGGNASQLMQARLGAQEHDLRKGVADTGTEPEQRHRNLQAIEGKPSPDVAAIGTGMFADLTAADQTPQATALGESMIDENAASAASTEQLGLLREDQRLNPARYQSGGAAAGGIKPGAHYMLNPNFDPAQPPSEANQPVMPIPGGKEDPNTRGKMGVRERQVVARVLNAAANNAADLSNIVEMPSGASSGVLGSGMFAEQGIGIMDAVVSQMKQKLSPEEVDNYNAMLGGLTSSMVTLERMGMQGTSGLAEEFGALVFRPDDTIERKMLKLALIRQSTENAVETVKAVNPLPPDSVAFADATMEAVRRAVPYTPRDVIELQRLQQADPQATLRSVIKSQHGIEANQGGAPADASGGDITEILLEQGAKYNAQGQLVDDRGWHLEQDGDDYAWVNPERTDFEPIAFTPGMN
jgi:hypothetical protein